MQSRKAQFTIRQFRPEFDCTAIGTLYRASIHQLASDNYDPETLEAWSRWSNSVDSIALTLSRGQTLIAQHGGRIAGFAHRHPISHINMLCTHPDFARRGIARTLLEELSISARRESATHLTANANQNSKTLFEKKGFVVDESEWVEHGDMRVERFLMALKL